MTQTKATILSLFLCSLLFLFTTAASATEPMVAAGTFHSLALKGDGTVWAWGQNSQGQLGNGTGDNSLEAVQVVNIEKVVSIAAGSYHSLALKEDGTVWAWGDNDFGQLGDNSEVQRDTPVQVQEIGGSPLSSVIFIASGGAHCMALKNDGSVWVWGNNSYGQLGDNSTTKKGQALQVTALSDIVAIAGGGSHSLALKNDGTVWAWGDNDEEQLGDGTNTESHVPIQVQDGTGSNLTAVTAISANSYQSFALLQDKTVKGWGEDIGAVPTTIVDINNSPVQNIKILGQGRGNHLLAIKTDGTAWAGGYNGYGQLGDDTSISKPYAVQIRGYNNSFLTAAISIAAGKNHSLAILANGKIASWGDNRKGQLGIGLPQSSSYPVQVIHENSTPLVSSKEIAAGYYHAASLLTDSSVQIWGRNGEGGALGDGSLMNRSTSSHVLQGGGVSLTGVLATALGDGFSLALMNDGTVWAWGENIYGQLGNDTTANSAVPVQVLCDFTDPHPPLSRIVAIAAGRNFAMALDEDDRIWTWGDNYSGQLGDGTTDDRSYAHRIALTGVTSIAAGNYHALALTTTDTVAAWGNNYSGQVGNKTNDDQYTPHGVLGETFPIGSITKISANGDSSLALRTDGKIYSWGDNGDGQLGDGTTDDRNWADLVLAAPSTPLTGIVDIAAGYSHALAIKDSSGILSWGGNFRGQLGDGSTIERYFPVQTTNQDGSPMTNGASIAAGDDFSVIQKIDGTVWTTGRNDYGQLGDGTKKWITYEVKDFSVKNFSWSIFLPAIVTPKH